MIDPLLWDSSGDTQRPPRNIAGRWANEPPTGRYWGGRRDLVLGAIRNIAGKLRKTWKFAREKYIKKFAAQVFFTSSIAFFNFATLVDVLNHHSHFSTNVQNHDFCLRKMLIPKKHANCWQKELTRSLVSEKNLVQNSKLLQENSKMHTENNCGNLQIVENCENCGKNAANCGKRQISNSPLWS